MSITLQTFDVATATLTGNNPHREGSPQYTLWQSAKEGLRSYAYFKTAADTAEGEMHQARVNRDKYQRTITEALAAIERLGSS